MDIDQAESQGTIAVREKSCIWCCENIVLEAKICKVCGKHQNKYLSMLKTWHVIEIAGVLLAGLGAFTALYQANEAKEALKLAEGVRAQTEELNTKYLENKKLTDISISANDSKLQDVATVVSMAQKDASDVVADIDRSKEILNSLEKKVKLVKKELSASEFNIGMSFEFLLEDRLSLLKSNLALQVLFCGDFEKTLVTNEETYPCVQAMHLAIQTSISAYLAFDALSDEEFAGIVGIDLSSNINSVCAPLYAADRYITNIENETFQARHRLIEPKLLSLIHISEPTRPY